MPTRSSLGDLPYDIRTLIYEHAVANSQVHIIPERGRLVHFPCVAPERSLISQDAQRIDDRCMLCNDQSQGCGAQIVAVSSPLTFRPTWVAIPPSGIPLLRTCKAIYAEAAHLVYTRNLFMMHSLGALFRFVETVPTHYLALIKTAYVSTNVNGAHFVRADYGTHGLQRIPRDLAPLFMFNYFDSDPQNGEHSQSSTGDRETTTHNIVPSPKFARVVQV